MTSKGAPVCRLVYIANARLPTEKAHGRQICRVLSDCSLGDRLAGRAPEAVGEYTWERWVAKLLTRLGDTGS